MKTVALYLRVSSVDQHPETQLYDLRAMAQQRGFQIVAEYTDRMLVDLVSMICFEMRAAAASRCYWSGPRTGSPGPCATFSRSSTNSIISTSSSSASARISIPAARSGGPS